MGGDLKWLSRLETVEASVGEGLLGDWAPELAKSVVTTVNWLEWYEFEGVRGEVRGVLFLEAPRGHAMLDAVG